MNQETNHESFLTPKDFGKDGVSKKTLEQFNGHPIGEGEKKEYHFRSERISFPDLKEENLTLEEKKIKPRLDIDQITFDDVLAEKLKNANLTEKKDEEEKPIGQTPTGLPLYRNENPREIYKKNPTIEEINDVNCNNLNKDYLAFINSRSLGLIRELIKTDINDKELARKIIAFERGTSIFYDIGDSIHLDGRIFAIKDISPLDFSDCPANTEHYFYLTNLSNNLKVIKRKHTTVIESGISHPINLPVWRSFFANPQDAIQVKVSIKDENGIIERH